MPAGDKEDLAEKAKIARLRAANESTKKAEEEKAKEATEKVVMEGGSSTDKANRLKGETASEANERITKAYKELTAKPVLSQEQIDAGAKVQWVRTGAGGVGEWTVVVPPGYKGERTTTKWTDGIIPAGSKYTKGSSVGKKIVGGKVVGGGSTPIITTGSKDGKTEGTGTKYNTKFESGRQAERIDKLRADAAASGKKLSFKDLGEWTINAYDRDPVTGEQRTAKQVVDAMLADLNLVDPESIKETYKGAARLDVTGKTTREWNLGEIKQQLLYSVANSGKDARFTYRQIASDVTNYLRSNASQGLREIFAKDKSFWQGVYNPEDVGKIVTSPYAEDLGRKVYLVDPNNPVVPKNILEQLQGQNVQFIDPVTGNALNVDPRTGNVVDYGTFLGRVTPRTGYDYLGNYIGDANVNKFGQPVDENGNVIKDTGDGNNADINDGAGGNDGTGGNDGNKNLNKNISTETRDAFALLEDTFRQYGLEELVDEIKDYMERGLGANEATIELRKSQPYKDRFKGNELRISAGLNALSEGEYLALEDAYSKTLRAYGLQNYFGTDRKVKNLAMANIIGNDIDATEFKDRIDTVVTRVNNADPAIKRTLVSFYNINDTDLIKYFLDPKANLPKLQEKVTTAEIGAAALGQGLATNVSDATALALFGITRGQALEGYAKIGETLPTAKRLSDIYAEEKIDYTQKTAEEEVFKGLASAERKRRQLAAREVATFGGASGVSKSAFGSATGGAF